ncbi:MAG TPA: hypothetical protein VLB90_07340 [Pseudomonadales bacterium]|nr:hypothetical protein [Pseudomonadales bacterium]
MQNDSNINVKPATSDFWTSRTALWASMAMLPAIVYMAVIWRTTANTPQGDGYIASIFAVLYYLDADSLFEKISHTLWTYFQHRAVLTKIAVLSEYAILGHLDMHILCFFGNLMLCVLVYLIARNILQHALPTYSMLIASLMILSIYSWSVATWPLCTYFYYGTTMFAFACFYLLDLPRPHIFLAAVCSWLAAFTMANGLLSIVIGSLIVIYHQHYNKRYSSLQLQFWSASVIGCLAVHFATMNVFSTDLYGAKSIEESFINLSGRAIDFLESMGAAPFFPDENRYGKIVLGCTILATMAAITVSIATSRKQPVSPAIFGLMLFSTGTLFLTSLFRYSAGGNDGYQFFTATNMAAIFVIATGQIDHKRHRFLPPLMLITALLFNLNALISNHGKMLQHRNSMTKALESSLLIDKPDNTSWVDVITYEGMARNIYTPLQSHQALKIPTAVNTLEQCPVSNTQAAGNITSTTSAEAFAMKVSLTLPTQSIHDNVALVLCGQKNYRLTLSSINLDTDNKNGMTMDVLLDKREYEHATYRAYLQNGPAVMALPELLTIPAAELHDRRTFDCQIMKNTFTFKKGFYPIIEYYCQNI